MVNFINLWFMGATGRNMEAGRPPLFFFETGVKNGSDSQVRTGIQIERSRRNNGVGVKKMFESAESTGIYSHAGSKGVDSSGAACCWAACDRHRMPTPRWQWRSRGEHPTLKAPRTGFSENTWNGNVIDFYISWIYSYYFHSILKD